MFEKVKSFADRYDEIEKLILDPAVIGDSTRYGALMKERAKLAKWATRWHDLLKARQDKADAEAMLSDPSIKELAGPEHEAASTRERKIVAELENMLLESDETSERSVIMEIRPGVGGDEAALFANELRRMYVKYAGRKGWTCELLEVTETELGGLKYGTFTIEGDDVYKFMRFESGTHRVQRVPATEASGRVHTSTATVAVMPQAEDVDVELNLADVRIDTYSAGGPGGQHVNKTQSAVRLTHGPTGIVVQCQDQRSQIRNRELAFRWLKARLYEHVLEKASKERSDLRRVQIGTGDRSFKIRTYNFHDNRVTDVRLGSSESFHNLAEILEGTLEEVHAALLAEDRRLKLQALSGR
jgi:peptide chain release factor 1